MTGPLRLRDDLAWVDGDDRVVVLDLTRLDQPPLMLESSAGAIWQALAGGPSPDTLVETVAEAHGADPDEVRDDVLRFVDQLVARGLVVSG